MHIRVIYRNDHYDYVKDITLDELIRSGKVKKFFRPSEGWVTIGIDPVRERMMSHDGPERRKAFRSQLYAASPA